MIFYAIHDVEYLKKFKGKEYLENDLSLSEFSDFIKNPARTLPLLQVGDELH